MNGDPTPLAEDDLIEVNAFLRDGDVVAVPSGNMAGVYRVRNDAMNGEAYLAFEGIAAITGATNIVRKLPK